MSQIMKIIDERETKKKQTNKQTKIKKNKGGGEGGTEALAKG